MSETLGGLSLPPRPRIRWWWSRRRKELARREYARKGRLALWEQTQRELCPVCGDPACAGPPGHHQREQP